MKKQTRIAEDFDLIPSPRPPRQRLAPFDIASMRWIVILWVPLMTLSLGCENSSPTPAPAKGDAPKTVDAGNDPKPGIDVDSAQLEAGIEEKELAANFKEKIPPTLVEFDMILVPTSDQNKKPFYIGKTEVTWDEFAYWALCKDIKEKKAILERERKLRPSAPHDSERIYRGWGQENQPVVGISRLSAELYCAWLSEQTGKKYRLPTPEEWDAAFIAGGGKLDESPDKSKIKDIAWYEGNTFDEDTFDNRAMPVGKKAPNAIGIHDMLGNVAEWVSGDAETKVARGGSFITKAEELKGGLAQIEDQAVWNKNYPNEPKSIWWYVDADYVGFRVVCEP